MSGVWLPAGAGVDAGGRQVQAWGRRGPSREVRHAGGRLHAVGRGRAKRGGSRECLIQPSAVNECSHQSRRGLVRLVQGCSCRELAAELDKPGAGAIIRAGRGPRSTHQE